MSAAPWYNPAWRYRCKITIPAAQLTGVLTDHPVYVPGSVLPAAVYTGAQANGNDLLFTASDGTTKLAHERVHWVPASSGAELHFKAPSLTNLVANEFYLYWGNPTCASQASAAAVWSNGYAGVFHLGESGAGGAGAGVYVNSVTGAATGLDYVDPGTKSGKLYGTGGETFDGSNDYIDTAIALAAGTFSLSFWAARGADEQFLFGANAGDNRRAYFGVSGGNRLYVGAGNASVNTIDPGVAIPATWAYYVLSADGSTATPYMNGAAYATTAYAWAEGTMGRSIYIGDVNAASTAPLAGTADEFRISTVARAAAWIAADYANQNSPATFLTVGGVEQPSSPLHRLNAYGRYRRRTR